MKRNTILLSILIAVSLFNAIVILINNLDLWKMEMEYIKYNPDTYSTKLVNDYNVGDIISTYNDTEIDDELHRLWIITETERDIKTDSVIVLRLTRLIGEE